MASLKELLNTLYKNYLTHRHIQDSVTTNIIYTHSVTNHCKGKARGVTCVPIVMYGLRLFIQELHCLSKCLHVCMIRVRGCYHFTKFRCSIPSGF